VAGLVVSTAALLGLPTVTVLGLPPTVNVLQGRGGLLVVIWLVGSALELLGLLGRHRLPRLAVVPPALGALLHMAVGASALPIDLAVAITVYQAGGLRDLRQSLVIVGGLLLLAGVWSAFVAVVPGPLTVGSTAAFQGPSQQQIAKLELICTEAASRSDSGCSRLRSVLNGRDALLLPVSDWGGFVVLALGLAVPWWAGLSSRNRRLYLAQLEQRARDLELGRAREAEFAAARERARITRELHDVVAHNVTVMVIQAQGVQARLESEPAQAQAGLDAIVTTGREALVEIRRLLGVVREDTEEPLLAPEPGVDQLPALVEQLREAGVDVGLVVEGVPQPLPAGVGLTAYRIVQESLTNALRHSVAEIPPRVRLHFEPHQMSIVVESSADPAPQAGAGIGLAGMRERASLVGGQLLAGPTPEGGYRVQARLPLDPAS